MVVSSERWPIASWMARGLTPFSMQWVRAQDIAESVNGEC